MKFVIRYNLGRRDANALFVALTAAQTGRGPPVWLELIHIHLDESLVNRLSRAFRGTDNLLSISIDDCSIESKHLSTLLGSIRGKSLRHFCINKVVLLPRDLVATLRLIGAHPDLEALTLSNCKLGAVGMAALFEVTQAMDKLRVINLAGNAIGDAGARIFRDALPNHRALTSILLNHNEIGEEGGEAIVEAIRWARKDAGCKVMVFGLYGNKFSPAACQKIRQLHPHGDSFLDVDVTALVE